MRKLFSVKIMLLLAVVLCILTGLITYEGHQKKVDAQQWVTHTYEVLQQAFIFLERIKDAEVNHTNYLITDKPLYRESLQADIAAMKNQLGILRSLTSDNKPQTRLIDSKIHPYINERIRNIEQSVFLHNARNPSANILKTSFNEKVILDSIQAFVHTLTTREQELVKTRTATLTRVTFYVETLLYGFLILIGFTSILAYITIHKGQQENKILIKNITNLNNTLEERITEQTKDLANKNIDLLESNHELAAINEELQSSEEMLQNTITQYRIAQEKLLDSEKLYRLISTNSKDLISLYNAEANPVRTFISPSSKTIMGYEPEELLGHSPFNFIHPDDVKDMKEFTHPRTMSGNSATKEYRAIKKDGTMIWLESISNPFFDDNGVMIGFQTSARDITQRKSFEEQLVTAKENSEEASRLLKNLLNEKNDFIGLLSHDMRSPINQIKGLAFIMSMSLDDKETLKDCIAKLTQACALQLTLYENVILMLKADQSHPDKDKFSNYPLGELIKKIVTDLEWELKNKSIHVEIDIEESINLNIHQGLFTQAIHNLLTNAIKFSPSRNEIRIHARKEDKSIRLVIEDDGIGFHPEKAERLFDRFTKEGRAGTNNETSTGLGLYLVKQIIEDHQGTIRAKSDGEGKGATFSIDFKI